MFITDYPADIKPFYARRNDDERTASLALFSRHLGLLIIGQISGVDRGCISLAHSFGVNPFIQDREILPQETRDIFYRMVQSLFRYFVPLRRDSRVLRTDRRTDGRTDIIIAYAALNYIVRPTNGWI